MIKSILGTVGLLDMYYYYYYYFSDSKCCSPVVGGPPTLYGQFAKLCIP